MGYPMTYPRVVHRNGIDGDYSKSGYDETQSVRTLIAGDMRRLELDQRDPRHLKRYAEYAGITDHQAWLVLTAFFTDFAKQQPSWLAAPCWPDNRAGRPDGD